MRSLPAAALLFPLAANAVGLELEGDCPGPVGFYVDDVSPSGLVEVYSAAGAGAAILPSGPCAGTATGLADDGLTLRATLSDSDGDGALVIRPRIPGPACGLTVQVVDLETCTVSEALPFRPVVVPRAGTLLAAQSGLASGIYEVDLASGAVRFLFDPGIPITGMDADDDGNLYVIEGGGIRLRAGAAGDLHRLDPHTGSLELVASTGMDETSLVYHNGLLYTADMYTSFAAVDPNTGSVTATGAIPGGVGFGYAMASDGRRILKANATDLYEVDELGDETLVTAIAADVVDQRGGALTVHDGEILTILDTADGLSALYTIDPLTGETADTGIVFPVGDIDAIVAF